MNFIVEINKSKLKSHEKVCGNNVFCRIVIPSENRFSKQILKNLSKWKSFRKVRAHCRFTCKYKGAAHSI